MCDVHHQKRPSEEINESIVSGQIDMLQVVVMRFQGHMHLQTTSKVFHLQSDRLSRNSLLTQKSGWCDVRTGVGPITLTPAHHKIKVDNRFNV